MGMDIDSIADSDGVTYVQMGKIDVEVLHALCGPPL